MPVKISPNWISTLWSTILTTSHTRVRLLHQDDYNWKLTSSCIFVTYDESTGFLVGAFLVKSARLLQWLFFFFRPQTSSCMCHFLVQTLIGLRGTQVRVLALARNFFEHWRKRTRLKGPLFQCFSALCDFFRNFFASKGSPFFDILQQTEVPKSPKGPPF